MRREQGFTLIELLIVVAIIGLLAAIAIPNMLNAMQRAKQKRTMADMRDIASALETRHVEVNTYTAAGILFSWPSTTLAYTNLHDELFPTYMRNVPEFDGWNSPLQFTAEEASYGIRSLGGNRIGEGTDYTLGPFHNFNCDIVYSNGGFITFPDGVQASGT
ncbi:MAG TPA: prepilin-type N-terminal cleavage/methylation domain-containing protein [Thermoanaerobaculia bacterium]|nr:prepilin-type N-terminal cleavage/methylation domain-containing protein [Thermoanaerobaculia bacterium]